MMAMLTPEITATFTYMDDQLSMAAPDLSVTGGFILIPEWEYIR